MARIGVIIDPAHDETPKRPSLPDQNWKPDFRDSPSPDPGHGGRKSPERFHYPWTRDDSVVPPGRNKK